MGKLDWGIIIATSVVLFILIGVPVITTIKDRPQVECLGEYARDYCDGKNLVLLSYDKSGFRCGEDERVYEPTKYRYLPGESEICKYAELGVDE